MALPLSLTELPGEILCNFWKYKKVISDRSRQKGLQYAVEGYIQAVRVTTLQRLQLMFHFIYKTSMGSCNNLGFYVRFEFGLNTADC